MQELWATLVNFSATAGLKLLGALIILIIGWILIKKLVRLIETGKALNRMDATAKRFLCMIIGLLLRALLIITLASQLGVPMTSVIALVSTAGLTVGLALQGSLSNIAGSFIIICFHLYKIGDYISAGGQEGTVTGISLFYTTLSTQDNKRVVIPNSAITSGSVIDFSSMPQRRIDLDFSVAYESDIDTVRSVLLDAARADEKVLTEPAPCVYLSEQADSALVFKLRVWVKNADYWDVTFGLNEAVKRALDKNHISIPFPQLDVHLDN